MTFLSSPPPLPPQIQNQRAGKGFILSICTRGNSSGKCCVLLVQPLNLKKNHDAQVKEAIHTTVLSSQQSKEWKYQHRKDFSSSVQNTAAGTRSNSLHQHLACLRGILPNQSLETSSNKYIKESHMLLQALYSFSVLLRSLLHV